jgi:hypothetical protein
VELGFIDGAHSRRHVENDTAKMAVMMADRGLVFWHDYGGKGRFRDLTCFLDRLSRRVAVHRVLHTSLAWTTAAEIRKAYGRASGGSSGSEREKSDNSRPDPITGATLP